MDGSDPGGRFHFFVRLRIESKVVAVLLFLASATVLTAGASAMMPEPLWDRVELVGLRCDFAGLPPEDGAGSRLCEYAAAVVRAGMAGAVPVDVIAGVEERLVAPGTLLVLIQGRVEPAGAVIDGKPGLIVTMGVRLARHAQGLPAPPLFGVPPRAVYLPDGAAMGSIGRPGNAVTQCLDMMLSQAIPALRPPAMPLVEAGKLGPQ